MGTFPETYHSDPQLLGVTTASRLAIKNCDCKLKIVSRRKGTSWSIDSNT